MTDISTEPTPETSRKGLILINTGPGKGKTTAALGTVSGPPETASAS
ncbi:MAG: ATP:corrinoid adenosyltransferase BtuR/CobO/CobP [Acidobacteriaceae bacterium]|nr:ATP:corrinoid adenosyltransferase BtuR/CobO/CobP [Acidobacteriaceae bacterium]